LLSTGVDIPTCKNVVLFRPIGSVTEFKQIIGRGTRLFPDADKLSFTIVDYANATTHFADPEFDGLPEEIVEVDQGTDPVEVEIGERARKYYVDDGEAYVTAEAVYLLVAGASTPQIVEYEDYVADQVRRLYPAANDLRSRWRTADGRDEVINALEVRGISLGELAERTGLADADPFDLLVYVAWNGSLTSRRERATKLRREHVEFFDRFQPEARAILEELVDKYADHGVNQLDDLHILEVPPLSRFGTPVEIATRFGGVAPLRDAVSELQELLYVA